MFKLVENTLTVTGPVKKLERFQGIAEPLSMERLLPTPEDFREIMTGTNTIDGVKYRMWMLCYTKEIPIPELVKRRFLIRYGTVCRNQWRIANWGTRFDLVVGGKETEVKGVKIPYGLKYCFETTSSPPLPFVKNLSKTFPTLAFRLHFIDFPDFEGEFWAQGGNKLHYADWQPSYEGWGEVQEEVGSK